MKVEMALVMIFLNLLNSPSLLHNMFKLSRLGVLRAFLLVRPP